VQTTSVEPARPYTRAIAHDAGWQWRIPLQHRVGNGIVYDSDFLSDDAARERLLGSVEGTPLTEPKLIRFTTGRRQRAWEGNCISLSLASGFVEPLESTSIHLVMVALTRLLQVFPFDGINPSVVARYNDQSRRELEGVRDFIILHYHLNQRSEPFWKRCATMPIPDTLAQRIALFVEGGQAFQSGDDLFRVSSWSQVMLGQRLTPKNWHRLARLMPADRLAQSLAELKAGIAAEVAKLPQHQAFLAGYCPETTARPAAAA